MKKDNLANNNEILLSCPFCGEKPTIVYKDAPNNIIECNNGRCPVWPLSIQRDTWKDAVKAWNTRTNPAMISNDMREAFEKWYSNYDTTSRPRSEVTFAAWQAAWNHNPAIKDNPGLVEAARNLFDNRVGHREDNNMWSSPQCYFKELEKELDKLALQSQPHVGEVK